MKGTQTVRLQQLGLFPTLLYFKNSAWVRSVEKMVVAV